MFKAQAVPFVMPMATILAELGADIGFSSNRDLSWCVMHQPGHIHLYSEASELRVMYYGKKRKGMNGLRAMHGMK